MSDEAFDQPEYYDDEPYSLDDDTWGTCHECGSGLENWGAVSDGDGDLYDELGCPLCQEPRGRANEIYLGDVYDGDEDDE